MWAAAAIGLALFVSAGVWFMATRVSSGERMVVPIRFDVARVEGQASPATRTFAVSPDGSSLVYAANSSLRIRAIGGDDLPLPARGEMPFFSPDGRWLAFFSENGLHRMPAGGGAVQLITAARSGRERAYGGTWGPDGTIVAARGGGLFQVGAQGGEIQIVADPDIAAGEVTYAWPEFLPGGRSVIFTSKGPTEDLMPAWSPDGTRVYYASNRAGGTFRIFSIDADGAGAEREEFAGHVSYMPYQMLTPGTLLAFASGKGAPQDLALLTLADRQARTFL